MSAAQWLTALMPVISVAVLLVVLRIPASRAMPIALLATIVLAVLVWGISFVFISASVIEGLIIAGSVVLIVVGALSFLAVMRASGGLALIRLEFLKVSPDHRIQLLCVGYLLVCFIEGAAGFGTPATVAAPLLIALGFPAMAAVCLTLVADVSAVTFGAVGTPIIVGIAGGTNRNYAVPEDAQFLTSVALHAAAIDIVAGMVIPVLMMYLLTNTFAAERGRRAFIEVVPLCLVAALSYSIPAFLWTAILGVEFGGILGAATGMGILLMLIRRRVLLPKRAWSTEVGYIDAADLKEMVLATRDEARDAHLSPTLVWTPYILLTIMLLATRMIDPLKALLNDWTIRLEDILGTGISAGFEPMYSPGVIFLGVAAVTAVIHGVPPRKLRVAAKETGRAVLGSAIVLAAAVPMVRVFLNSGVNVNQLPSMPLALAGEASRIVGDSWPLAAPWVGALGSFVSGSATFSHLMFASLQESVASSVGADPVVVLAQQVGGANAGNMVCVSNVVAVAAVCGLLGREGPVIRVTVIPMMVYTVLFAVIGYALA